MQFNIQSRFYSLPRIIISSLLMVMLNACGTTSSIHQSTAMKIKAASQAGTTITGYITESDGATPVYGATVAVLTKELPTQATLIASKENCTAPSKQSELKFKN